MCTTIPTIGTYENDLQNMDHLHLDLMRQQEKLQKEIDELKEFNKKLCKDFLPKTLKWVEKNSVGSDTSDLGKYKCDRRKEHDRRIEILSNILFSSIIWMKDCFLCPGERKKINEEIKKLKEMRKEFSKKREIPILNEDGSRLKGKTIIIKSRKSADEIRRELQKNGSLLISEEIMNSILEEKSCCSCDCGKKSKKGKVKTISIQMDKIKKEVRKMAGKNIANAIPFANAIKEVL